MAVRSTKIEIAWFGDESGLRDHWRDLSIACQRMINRLWQIWLVHHSVNGSADKLRSHFDAYSQWKKSPVGKASEWPCQSTGMLVDYIPKKGKNKGQSTPTPALEITDDPNGPYMTLRREFPEVNSAITAQILNSWMSLLKKRKAASGSLPGWVAILFGNESLPTFNRPQPIPFDKKTSRIFHDGTNYILEVRIGRLAGSSGMAIERCQLMLNKKKMHGVRSIVDRIISGEYKWKGSNLVYEKRHGKWFASIAYERLDAIGRKSLNKDKLLCIKPGKLTPWRVRIGGSSWSYGGDGSHVASSRRTIQRVRGERKEHYRWGGSNQKGHGRRRAESAWSRLSSRWKDFVKRYNNEVTTRLVRLAVARGAGRIAYFQPKDAQCGTRFLTTANNDESSNMSWGYFQFGSMLRSKCQDAGIEYVEKNKTPKQKKVESRRKARKASANCV